jgi:YHS domain-containing protein
MDVTGLVCGMTFDIERTATTAERDGWLYFFCSVECHHLFAEHPNLYLQARLRAKASTARQRRQAGAHHE